MYVKLTYDNGMTEEYEVTRVEINDYNHDAYDDRFHLVYTSPKTEDRD